MTTTASPSTLSPAAAGVGNRLAFDQIDNPGTYVCNWSGHLLRVPEDGTKAGRSPVLEIRGKEQLDVTKLSSDPFVALTKARMIASNLDLPVNF